MNKVYTYLFMSIYLSYMDLLTPTAYQTISNHVFAEVRQNSISNQKALFALRSFNPGDVIANFSAGTISADPTYLTVQVGIRKHITLQPEFLQYINHHCDPNVFFNTTTMELTALREILPGEEFGFFYPSTEWRMTQSFDCYCGSNHCIGKICGAAFLPPEISSRYRLTDFIQQQLAKRKRIARKVA